jgi:hypothetical protein
MLKVLITQGGADLENTGGGRFDPPVHQALENLNAEMVKLFLIHGANLNAENGAFDTVLDAAKILNESYITGNRRSKFFALLRLRPPVELKLDRVFALPHLNAQLDSLPQCCALQRETARAFQCLL